MRMSVHVLPVGTLVANPLVDQRLTTGLWIVPRDDDNCWRFSGGQRILTPQMQQAGVQLGQDVDAQGRRITTADNDYLLNRGAQRSKSYTGIVGVSNQDYAVTESMGPIYDRTKEHLGTTDLAILRLRQLLIRVARDLERGIEPPGLYADVPWHEVRSEERVLDDREDWHTLGTEADARYRELVASRR